MSNHSIVSSPRTSDHVLHGEANGLDSGEQHGNRTALLLCGHRTSFKHHKAVSS